MQYAVQVDKQNTPQYRLFLKSLKEMTMNLLSKGNECADFIQQEPEPL